jgi:hypothetical protein
MYATIFISKPLDTGIKKVKLARTDVHGYKGRKGSGAQLFGSARRAPVEMPPSTSRVWPLT